MDPTGVGGGGAAGEGDELGAFVRMEAGPEFLQGRGLAGGGFCQDKKFARFLPFSLPDVMGLKGRQNLNTRRRLGFQGGAGEMNGVRFF